MAPVLTNDEIKGRVRDYFSTIASGFDPKGRVLNKLFEKGVITPRQYKYVDHLSEAEDRSKELLLLLLGGVNPDAFVWFREALLDLKEYQWIVRNLIDTSPTENKAGNISSTADETLDSRMCKRKLELENQLMLKADLCDKELPETGEKKICLATEPDTICEHNSQLINCLDIDHGLLDYLNGKILCDEECQLLEKLRPYPDQNREFLRLLKSKIKKYENGFTIFLDGLDDTKQQHVINIVKSNVDGDIRPLTKAELSIIEENAFCILQLIDIEVLHFLNRLVQTGAITRYHKESIKAQKEKDQKNEALLTILFRRSFKNFTSFKECLYETLQKNIVPALEKLGIADYVGEVKGAKDQKIIEELVAKVLTGFAKKSNLAELGLTESQVNRINKILEEFEKRNIYILGASKENSFRLFFLCETLDSLEALDQMYYSGHLNRILVELVNILDDGNSSLLVATDGKLFHESIKRCRTYFVTEERQEKSLLAASSMEHIPWFIMQMILQRAAFALWIRLHKKSRDQGSLIQMSIKTMLQDNMKKFEYISLYIIYTNFSSVRYLWWHILTDREKSFRKRFLHQSFFGTLHKSREMLLDRLDLNHGLLEMLVEQHVVSDDDVAEYDLTKLKAKDRFELEERKQDQIRRFIRCLKSKTFRKCTKFVQLMKENGLQYLVNHIISFGEYQICNQKAWPIDSVLRSHVRANHDILVNIVDLTKVIGEENYGLHTEEKFPSDDSKAKEKSLSDGSEAKKKKVPTATLR